MLSRAVKQHQSKQSKLREENELLKKTAMKSVNVVTHSLMDVINSGVADAFANEKLIEAEAKQLHSLASRYAKQTTQWLAMVENFNKALKEMGDIESWSRAIEADMKTVALTLENVALVQSNGEITPVVSTANPN